MALKLRKNDNVMIIAGKERGTTGKILKVLSHRATQPGEEAH